MKQRNDKDPRHIVTPDAFTISPEVIGLPLATPKRRTMAMLIDLLIIQQLSQIDSSVLGLSIVVLLFLLSRSNKKSVGTLRSTIFKILAIVGLLFVIGTEYYDYQQTHQFSFFKSSEATHHAEKNDGNAVTETINDIKISNEKNNQVSQDKINQIIEENRKLKSDRDMALLDLIDALAHKFGYGFGWAGLYFTLIVYVLHGQTLGKLIMRIKIIQLDGKPIGIWSSFGRYGGYAASFVTGLSGFIQILWDPNRQGLHDKVSNTVVVKI